MCLHGALALGAALFLQQVQLAPHSKPFQWDAVQMPINILDAHYRSFQSKLVPECHRRGIGVIGMKALPAGAIPKELGLSAADCRRYALSQPISTLVCGMTSRENLRGRDASLQGG